MKKKRILATALASLSLFGAAAGATACKNTTQDQTELQTQIEGLTQELQDEKLNTIYQRLNTISTFADGQSLDIVMAMAEIESCKESLDQLKLEYIDLDGKSLEKVNDFCTVVRNKVLNCAVSNGLSKAMTDYYKVVTTQTGPDAGQDVLYANGPYLYARENPNYLSYSSTNYSSQADRIAYYYDLTQSKYEEVKQNVVIVNNGLASPGSVEIAKIYSLCQTAKDLINDKNSEISFTDSSLQGYTIEIENKEDNAKYRIKFNFVGKLTEYYGSQIEGDFSIRYNFLASTQKEFEENYQAIVDRINELKHQNNLSV